MGKPLFKQCDAVTINTTKNVKWLSAPPGNATDPNGIWSVIGIVTDKLMLAKERTVICIPYSDVKLVASYDLEGTLKNMNEASIYGKEKDKTKSSPNLRSGRENSDTGDS